MFHDKNEELKRLEALLAEEEEDEQLLSQEDAGEEEFDFPADDAEAEEYDIDRFYMGQTRSFTAYNSDRTDTDLEEFSEEVWEGKQQGISPLVVLACVLATGVLVAVLYLVLRYGGFL